MCRLRYRGNSPRRSSLTGPGDSPPAAPLRLPSQLPAPMVHPPAPFWWGPLDLRAALSHGVLARAEGQPPRAELIQCLGARVPFLLRPTARYTLFRALCSPSKSLSFLGPQGQSSCPMRGARDAGVQPCGRHIWTLQMRVCGVPLRDAGEGRVASACSGGRTACYHRERHSRP